MQFQDLDTDRKNSSAPVKRRVQVLIVGLGPAGTACGMGLANSGLDVLAIDRAHFPRDKICGDALTGDALRFLRENNIPSKIIQRSVSETIKPSYAELTHTLAEANGYSLQGTALRTREASFHSIRRIDLDNWLVECCAKAGLAMEFGWQMQTLQRLSASDPWCVAGTIRSRNGQVQERFEVTAEVVVGCDGVSSVVQNLTREQHAARPIALASRRYTRRDEVDTPDVSLMNYSVASQPLLRLAVFSDWRNQRWHLLVSSPQHSTTQRSRSPGDHPSACSQRWRDQNLGNSGVDRRSAAPITVGDFAHGRCGITGRSHDRAWDRPRHSQWRAGRPDPEQRISNRLHC